MTLRPTAAGDVPALTAILAQPAVALWWPGYDADRVERELVEPEADEAHYVIEHDGRIVGYIQSFEEEDPDFRHASIDLFLATEAHGQD